MKDGLRSYRQITQAEEQHAMEIHKKSIVIDGSNVPIVDTFLEKPITDGYFERMEAGGVTASNITVPYDVQADSKQALREFSEHREWLTRSSERTGLALCAEDIEKAKSENRTAVIFGPQNALILDRQIELLRIFYVTGLRILQLTYNTRNFIGDGCLEKANAGLSNFGLEVIEEMNKLGVLVDLSHCGKRTTLEAIEHSNKPAVFSHAGAAAVFSHPRNKSDEEIKTMAEKGGVIGISPYIVFLTDWRSGPRPTLDLMLDQIDYVSSLVGTDHVGIGSDVNDCNETRRALYIKEFPERLGKTYRGDYPEGFEHSLAYFPNITRGLVVRGYSDQEIIKILGGNFLRVFRNVWKP
jgi:membrane dipeptidase